MSSQDKFTPDERYIRQADRGGCTPCPRSAARTQLNPATWLIRLRSAFPRRAPLSVCPVITKVEVNRMKLRKSKRTLPTDVWPNEPE